ncbi:MAG: Phage-related baseplate assembly protein [Amycolatopsis sp.]|jgi:hypothetical protein|uniref:phage baseplate assembly protein V n=1 Tax=Amycolatopsis sp. TaxID=37632 RepID=UPI00262ACB6A|nr:phage baseplate assembly protein V [Amycolatopsis sp.]MCU1682720.1 Phage-related baseplate assembly protein [Amycolatopsis sp.]
MTTDAKKYHGLYQGVVTNNIDLTNENRVLVGVTDVLGGDPCIWASAHAAAPGMNVVPMIGSGVWIQFLDGDIDRAVWTGFWRGGVGDAPPVAQTIPPGVPQVVLGTPTQNYLLITDLPGPTGGIQIQLHGPAGPFIKMNELGIQISNGQGASITLGPGPLVSINNGALTIPF